MAFISYGDPLLFYVKRTCTQESIGMNKKKFIWRLKIGFLLLLAGGLISSGQLLQMRRNAEAETAQNPVTTSAPTEYKKPADVQTVSGKPVRIQIPERDINVVVADGTFNKWAQSWTLSKDKAHFATVTAPANNQEGLTFIYGHNTPEVFGRLNTIKSGETAIVTTDNGHVFTYKYRDSKEVAPTDVSLFNYKGAPILTLQTCSGTWSEKRHLLTFDLVEVK